MRVKKPAGFRAEEQLDRSLSDGMAGDGAAGFHLHPTAKEK
jgi:hypothetical protein